MSVENTNVNLRLVEMRFDVSPSEIIYFPSDDRDYIDDCFTAHFLDYKNKTIQCHNHNRMIYNLTNYPRHSYASYFSFSENCIVVSKDGAQLNFAENLQQCYGKDKLIIIICENKEKYMIHDKSEGENLSEGDFSKEYRLQLIKKYQEAIHSLNYQLKELRAEILNKGAEIASRRRAE